MRIIIICLALLPVVAFAAPPPGEQTDPVRSQWYRSLLDKDNNSCCGEGDCRPAQIERHGDGKAYVWVDPKKWPSNPSTGKWAEIDPARISYRWDSPDGDVACIGTGIPLCVVLSVRT